MLRLTWTNKEISFLFINHRLLSSLFHSSHFQIAFDARCCGQNDHSMINYYIYKSKFDMNIWIFIFPISWMSEYFDRNKWSKCDNNSWNNISSCWNAYLKSTLIFCSGFNSIRCCISHWFWYFNYLNVRLFDAYSMWNVNPTQNIVCFVNMHELKFIHTH